MRLLTQYIDPAEAAGTSQRLRAAGIMTRLDCVDPHVMQPSKSGAERIALWVVFDDQFDDALALLENAGHVPARVITAEEMSELEASADNMAPRSGKRILERAALLIIGVCLLGFIAFIALGVFDNW